jgi:isopenicillin N synthase-like dioxygenase
MSGKILVVDYQSPSAGKDLVQSLTHTGFAILKSVPVEQVLIDEVYTHWKAFFHSNQKFHYPFNPTTMDGFASTAVSEVAKGYDKKDLKEFFHAYQNKTLPNITEKETRDFQEKLIKMGSTLLGWLDQESEGHVSFSEPLENMINGSDMNLLRIIHYPPLPDNVEPGEVRAAAHEDINLITLLVTGTEPGLQAKDVNGNWHDVPCKPGYITVNSGDMLSMASKGHYPSTPHRVVNPPKQENRSRYSMPLFVHPRPDVLLDKLTAGEFLDERLKEIGLK